MRSNRSERGLSLGFDDGDDAGSGEQARRCDRITLFLEPATVHLGTMGSVPREDAKSGAGRIIRKEGELTI